MNETNLEAFNRVQNEQGTGKRYEVGKGIVDIPKTTTPTVTTTTPAPKRTPGLLDTAKEEQARIANDTKTAQRQADSYAAQMRQARIDAINTSFAPRIQREKVEGEGRMSRVAALNFKSGVVGSGVDTTRTGEQKGMNDKALQAIEDEKAIAINEAFGWADKLGKERAALLTEQAQTGAEANVKYAQDKVDTAMNALNTFAKSGKITSASDLKDVDPNTYDTLREVSGMSDAEVDAYLKVNTPEGTYQWNAAQVNGSTMYVPKIVNGKVTMDKVDLGFVPNKEVKSTVQTDSGVYVIYEDGTTSLIGGSGKNTGTATTGFKDTKIEQDFREDSVTLLDNVKAGTLTLDEAYTRLRKLYSPTEVSDDAIRAQLDIANQDTSTVTGTQNVTPASNSALEAQVEYYKKAGILNNADIRKTLKARGYSDAEINASSVGSGMTNMLNALESFLFVK